MLNSLVSRTTPSTLKYAQGAQMLVRSGSTAQRVSSGAGLPHTVRRNLAQPPRAVTPTPPTPSVYQAPDATNDPEAEAFQRQQMNAPRPSVAEEARTLVDMAKHGLLATLSSSQLTPGFPNSSVVEYAADSQGRPILAISTLSSHTPDVKEDGRISFTVKSPSFSGMGDARLTLQGILRPVTDEAERKELREAYLKKHPTAFYIDFADFKWFLMEEVVAARYNGGFGNAGRKLTVKDYLAAKPDPVAQFAAPVCGHMNADHMADNIAIVKGVCGLTVDECKFTELDRLGMNAVVKRNGQEIKVRVPFPRPVEDRKAIKEAIIEMTKAARAAQAASARTPGGSDSA